MITWSTLCRYLNENKKHIPKSVFQAVKREAVERYRNHAPDGIAYGPLLFDDLVNKCETSLTR